MTEEEHVRWRDVERALDELLDLEGPELAARLAALAASDPGSAREVSRLLAADDGERSALDLDASSLLGLVTPVTPDEAAAEAQNEAAAPASLGGYRLLERVASGGAADVYRAEPESGGDPVAIKLLRHDPGAGELARRLLREREILAGLEHPGIARLLDGGSDPEGRPYLVLEWVDGQDVVTWAASTGASRAERVKMLARIARVVEFAHARGVVHRDLKPSNVLVESSGRVRLLDFGIAKLLEDRGRGLETTSGVWLFTIDYAAPEQLRGKPTTPATDVYGLGQLIYELLAGQRAYERAGRPLSRILAELARERPRRGALGASSLYRLAVRCLAYRPEDRPASATEVAEALDLWLRDNVRNPGE